MNPQWSQGRGPLVADASPSSVDETAFYARNWAFIAPELQASLANTVVFAAGTGLSSTAIALACRTGFTRFIVADGDRVELSNLNRQVFTFEQLGQNKAVATADTLRRIRPDVNVEVLPYFLDERNCLDPLSRADIVVSSLDFDNTALFALNRAAQNGNKPVLFPLNLGWGGAVLVFTAHSPTLEDFIGLGSGSHSGEDVLSHLISRVFAASGGAATYLSDILQRFYQEHESWPSDPQLGIATFLTSAMIVRSAVALVAGEPVRVVPDVNHCDLRVLLDPPTNTTSSTSLPKEERDSRPPGENISIGNSSAAPSREHTMPPASATPAPYSYVQAVHDVQREMRYPELLSPGQMKGLKRRDIVYSRVRSSGLVVLAISHSALTPAQLKSLGEFRLQQCILAGLYDERAVAARALTIDPGLKGNAPNTTHVLVGTNDHRILAYCCMQAVEPPGQNGRRPLGWLGMHRADGMYMASPGRPLFPTEEELYGPGVFLSLPGVGKMHAGQVREVCHLVRNQAIQSPLSVVAVVEALYAMTQIMSDPKQKIELAVACGGQQTRKVMADLKLPALYAPLVPLAVTETAPDGAPWTSPSNFGGVFWPFVVASADLLRQADHLRQIDQALSLPANQVRRALVDLRRHAPAPEPRALLPKPGATAVLWTADAFYNHRGGDHLEHAS